MASTVVVDRGYHVSHPQRHQPTSGHVIILATIVVCSEDDMSVDVDVDSAVVGRTVGVHNEEVLAGHWRCEGAAGGVVGATHVGDDAAEGDGGTR